MARPFNELVLIKYGIQIIPEAQSGYVLTSDSEGNATWQPATGGGGGSTYTFVQSTPSATWTITHGLGFQVPVTTFDADNDWIIGELTYPSVNVAQVVFLTPQSGTAYLTK